MELKENKQEDTTIGYRTSALLTRLIPAWEKEPTFTRKLGMLADTLVCPQDREDFIARTRREHILSELADADQCFVNTRLNIDGALCYYQIQFSAIRVNGRITGIVAGIHSVDEQMRKELDSRKKLQSLLKESEEANARLAEQSAFTTYFLEPYMSAYYIGFNDLSCRIYKRTAELQSNYPIVTNYLDSINEYIDREVHPDDRAEFKQMILPETMRKSLREQPELTYMFRTDANDEDIICDKLRLNQVLLNILSNAIKYTADGGTVTMRVKEKTVKKSGYATYEFTVKDNGMGMDQEFLKTIFDPFTRVRSSTVSGIQGTGLGMAITKNIVDMMGGEISLKSTLGKGTEVKLSFEFKLQSAPKEPEEIPELKGVRALVADDDSNTCLSICEMVKDIGMRYEWCTSGKEAIIRTEAAYHGGDSFKVFIIDWIMPDMNGIETTRRIRKVIGDETPIIILTAYDWSDIEEEAREAGVTAFVSKPMFPSDLRRVLNSCLGKEPAREPAAQQQTEEVSFAGKKVLLVEDNEMNREIATEILEEDGFIVDTAEDVDVAVEKMRSAQSGAYDLVLMDIQMPTMDGYEATRQIRALGTEISAIPILAMTANAFEEDRKLALEAGMNEHIAKPIDMEKLKKMLAKFL